MQETQELLIWSLDQEDPLEKDRATHCRILAWRIPWTGSPGGLQSMGLQSGTWMKQLSMHTSFLRETFWVPLLVWPVVSMPAPPLTLQHSNMGRSIENQPNHNLVLILKKKKSHLESLLGQRYSVQYLLTLYLQVTNQTQSKCEKHKCTHPLTTQVLLYCKLIMEPVSKTAGAKPVVSGFSCQFSHLTLTF